MWACAAIVNDVLLLAAGVDDISHPYVVTGISTGGVGLSFMDEQRAHVVFLILSPPMPRPCAVIWWRNSPCSTGIRLDDQ